MNKIKLYPYINLTNDQLIDCTIKEMDKLKTLSKHENLLKYEKRKHVVNQLIIEIKRRNLKIKKPLLVRRIFNK
ncbi:MAG: hypothetical protein GX320_02505 [Tissierellia bacterium]|nr:hypothetical protein [Tissierellia bacterium]